MPANSRWDLIRRLRVKSFLPCRNPVMWDASFFPPTTCTSCGVARRPVRVVLTLLKGPNFYFWGDPANYKRLKTEKWEPTRFRRLFLGTDTIPSRQRFLSLLCNEPWETDIKINSGVGKAPVCLAAWEPHGSEGPQRLQNSKLCCGFFFRTAIS